MKRLFLSALLIASLNTWAAILERGESGKVRITQGQFKVVELIKDYAELKSKGLLMNDKIYNSSAVHTLIGPSEFSLEELDGLVSSILYDNGLSVINYEDVGLIKIIQVKDSRYQSNPVLTDESKIPNNDNFIRFVYKLNYADPRDIDRFLRPLTGRYSRIISNRLSGHITIHERARAVKKMLKIIKSVDTPESAKRKKQKEKEASSEALASPVEIKSPLLYLLVALFTLVGGIIGFLSRGYLIRRIEGGL